MSDAIKSLKSFIEEMGDLTPENKQELSKLVKAVEKYIVLIEFKLDRTERIKNTTDVLLEETIDELQEKRRAIEESNTALQKSLEELKSAQTQLIHSEKMASLGELTAGIAHEIKNPLNFVNNFADVSQELIEEMSEELDNGDFDEARNIAKDLMQNLQKINHHGQRADSIVKSMLLHSRTGSGEKHATDINNLADEYMRLAYHGLRAKDNTFNAEMETTFDQDIPSIQVISQDIGRVFLNLITNAFQAVHERRKEEGDAYVPKVSLKTQMDEKQVVISIRDNAKGISSELTSKIFQPFFTTKPTGQGTGLGLSISFDIVKAHGGKLELDSMIGKGSEFVVSLPLG